MGLQKSAVGDLEVGTVHRDMGCKRDLGTYVEVWGVERHGVRVAAVESCWALMGVMAVGDIQDVCVSD